MKYWGLSLAIVMATTRSYAVDVDPSSETITSLDQVAGLARTTQEFFWQLVPPMDDPLYIHPDSIVRAVDWKSKEWPNVLKKQMVAEMETVNSSMYPFYRMTVVETRTGELVYYNFDQEVWRTPAPLDYNPYLLAFLHFGVESMEDLTALQLGWGRSSNVGTEILLLPQSFMESFEEDAAVELAAQQELLAAQEAAMASSGESETVAVGISLVPVNMEADFLAESGDLDGGMAMMSSPPPPPGGGGGTNNPSGGSSNLVVELAISLPEGYGNGYIEIFTKDDLVCSPSWALADGWLATYGEQTVYWIDPASSNKMQRFYYIGDGADADGDGYSDLMEAWHSGTDSNSFNFLDVDTDGMHDWWETKLFGDLSQSGMDDFDLDGLLNNEELVFVSVSQPAIMLTDPSLYSSDGDALSDAEQFDLPPTDPWNDDVSVPVATIVSPTNNAVVVF